MLSLKHFYNLMLLHILIRIIILIYMRVVDHFKSIIFIALYLLHYCWPCCRFPQERHIGVCYTFSDMPNRFRLQKLTNLL